MRLFLIMLFLIGNYYCLAQNKSQQTEKKFEKILKTIENSQFTIAFNIAIPANDINIRIDSAYVYIQGDSACGYLPYYTAAYSFPQTGKKGIVFNNPMIQKTLKIKGKKNKKAIFYAFDIVGENDIYRLQMDIHSNAACYLLVTSRRRGPISYIGRLYISE